MKQSLQLFVSLALFLLSKLFIEAQCKSVFRRDTYALKENCLFYFSTNDDHRLEKDFDCYANTTHEEATPIITKAETKLDTHSDLRVRLHLADGDSYRPEVFQPIAEKIIIFGLFGCQSSTVTTKLPSLEFTNMERFSLQDCPALQIKKTDFSPFKELKVIYFAKSTIASLEAGTFFDLPNLLVLGLEFGWGFEKSFTTEQNAQLKKLHCDCDSKWFWGGLKGKAFGNITDGQEQWLVPVDCSKNQWNPSDITWNQTEITINKLC
ncbi:uncharacterized protein LOC129582716 [Paramacrobiotus metropolitanus]|uniref:uncharacterized protein LOC129582716 n=1 Tax=Paramacrobiotus metropolitanus TaxID=2943436 RepID=UPI0024460D70|nr:uncharacterized protein LOC129582716 [Paramacrobiotus metropolitanus]